MVSARLSVDSLKGIEKRLVDHAGDVVAGERGVSGSGNN